MTAMAVTVRRFCAGVFGANPLCGVAAARVVPDVGTPIYGGVANVSPALASQLYDQSTQG